MEDIIPNFSYDSLHDSSDLLFNSYYDSSYDSFDLLFNIYHNPLPSDPIFELHDSSHGSYDSSDLFLEIYNETQLGNERIGIITHPENENMYDGNSDH